MSPRVAALLLATAVLAADEPTPESQLANMKWLAGTWTGKMWGGEFTAYYSTPEGGKILSYSLLKKNGRRSFHEFEKFDVQKGKLVYLPFPGGRRAVHLLLTEAKTNRAVFENPKKDYPTRMTFERTDNTLRITLTDPHNKSPKKEVFVLQRTP